MAAVSQNESFTAPLRAVVGGGLRLDNHIVDPLFRFVLAEAGASSDNLRHVGFIGAAQILIVAEIGGPQP